MSSAIIAFSQLRWDSVFQRPQQLLARLAAHQPVVYVETPSYHPGPPFLEMQALQPNLTLCRPHTPVLEPGFHDAQLPHLRRLLAQVRRNHPTHLAWFDTPLALPLLREFDPQQVVYDCVGEVSTQGDAGQRERAALAAADLVLTSGPNRHRALRACHPQVHFFPGSVAARDFALALDRANSHPLHRDIPGPRLGFFGVLDTRFDAELVCALADAHPRWQLVLVGPVVGIHASALPRRPNIHYLGPQPYEELPRFLAGWDVGLLPYRCDASTRYLNPPGALEYLAAELPVVSSPLPDVVEWYGDAVTVKNGAADFVTACEQALLLSPDERAASVQKAHEVVAGTSWEGAVVRLRGLLGARLGSDVSEEGRDHVNEADHEDTLDAGVLASRLGRLLPTDRAFGLPPTLAGPGSPLP